MSKLVLETVKVPVSKIKKGDFFTLSENGERDYVKVNDNSDLLNKKAGKSYALLNGDPVELDANTDAFVLKHYTA